MNHPAAAVKMHYRQYVSLLRRKVAGSSVPEQPTPAEPYGQDSSSGIIAGMAYLRSLEATNTIDGEPGCCSPERLIPL
ncbi:MAG: hypothetical protein ACRD19_12505 [Terriglobia bacterium]